MRPFMRQSGFYRAIIECITMHKNKKDRAPHREIKAVIFDGELGFLTVEELMAMPPDRWGMLRDRLTDSRRGMAGELVARCLLCESPVYIQAKPIQSARLPLFAHFRGGNPDCLWYQGKNKKPNDVRAQQYRGQQESKAHRNLCELLEKLASLDRRYKRGSVGQYLQPKSGKHGRFPDVYVEWEGVAPFVLELQLSYTSETEVSDRYLYYQREDVNLIWVLAGLDARLHDLPQNFRDVIRRHRGNAFALDHAAIEASKDNQTLILSCYLQCDDGSFEPARQVRIDDLAFPNVGLAYYDDRIVEPLLRNCALVREPWLAALRKIDREWTYEKTQAPEVKQVIQSMADLNPVLLSDHWEGVSFLKLVAALFSAINSADGISENFLSHQPNIKGTLNSALINASDQLKDCALIIEFYLERSPLQNLLSSSVGKHVGNAKEECGDKAFGPGSWQWQACRRVVPEIFDPGIREQLKYFEALPPWANSN